MDAWKATSDAKFGVGRRLSLTCKDPLSNFELFKMHGTILDLSFASCSCVQF